MKGIRLYRLSYFGWRAEFHSDRKGAAAIREQANALVIERHGTDPKPLGYVQPGVPFPAYVPVEMFDHETREFYALS